MHLQPGRLTDALCRWIGTATGGSTGWRRATCSTSTGARARSGEALHPQADMYLVTVNCMPRHSACILSTDLPATVLPRLTLCEAAEVCLHSVSRLPRSSGRRAGVSMAAYHMQRQWLLVLPPLRTSEGALLLCRIALGRSHAEIAVGDTQVAAAFGAECRPTWEDGWWVPLHCCCMHSKARSHCLACSGASPWCTLLRQLKLHDA